MRSLRLALALLALGSFASASYATNLKVPPRVQKGGTCGLYALGMVMDYHHQRDPKQHTALVLSSDERRATSHTLAPTVEERLFKTAYKAGYTKIGGMFSAKDLGALAEKFGYGSRVVDHATLADVKAAIDRGNPVLMAYDVDRYGGPTRVHGDRAHWTVLTGYTRSNGVDYLHAQHAWDGRQRTWSADAFFASSNQLERSTSIDSHGGDITELLRGRMIEIVPKN